jgi:cytochrome c-type protein NapC
MRQYVCRRINQVIGPTALLYVLIGVSVALVAMVVFRPNLTATREGKIFAFLAFFALPIVSASMGASEHLERSKQRAFCLSCHVMEPHGRSLYVDDPHYLAAAHFQNHRVPADEACYTCHTDYTMYGGFRSKLRGLRHVYAYYVGAPMNPIHLYQPYNNRECLHCHAGARSFEDDPTHGAMLGDLKSNQLSCLSSGCHDTVHNVAQQKDVKFWSPSQ